MTPEHWRATYPEAAAALRSITVQLVGGPVQGVSETAVSADIALEAARRGQYLTRNNVGSLPDKSGRWVRFGLANGSKAENDVFKSADRVGIYPLTITPDLVGTTIGQFYSVEVKKPGGRVAQAQENWAALVTARGGRAVIIDSVEKLP